MAGSISIQGASDMGAVLRELKRVQAELGKVKQEARGVSRTSSRMTREMKQGFKSAAAGLGSMVTQYVSLGAAASVASQAIRDVIRTNDEAARRIRASEGGLSQLAQLSEGDPRKLQRLIGTSKQLFAAGAARSVGEAARVTFALESAGLLGQVGTFSDLAGIAEEPDVLARAVSTITTAFGKREAGSVRDIISKGLAASKFAPATLEQLLEATTRGAAEGKGLGLSDEELLAAVTVAARGTGSAEQGGTIVASLLRSLVKDPTITVEAVDPISGKTKKTKTPVSFQGLSLEESLDKIESLGLTDAERIKFFGRAEANRAFSILQQQRPLLATIENEIRQNEKTLLGQVITARESQPELVSARQGRIAEAKRKLAERPRGILAQTQEDIINTVIARREEEGANRGVTSLLKTFFGIEKFLTGDPEVFIRRFRHLAPEAAERGLALEQQQSRGGLFFPDDRDPEGATLVEERLRPTRVLGNDMAGPS